MSIKVLIIEDDLVIAESLKENLHELGYVIAGIAPNARKAITLYKESTPDICLVDIYLKGSAMNGIEIMEELRAGDDIPIIYLTAFDDQELRLKAKATNPAAYLVKPASKAQVDVAIDFALSNFRKRQFSGVISEETPNCPFITRKGYFFVRSKDRYEKVSFEDIAYVAAAGSYCNIYTDDNEYVVSVVLRNFLEQLNDKNICRNHRSYAVNLKKIQAFDDLHLYVRRGDSIMSLPISNQYKQEILENLPRIKTD